MGDKLDYLLITVPILIIFLMVVVLKDQHDSNDVYRAWCEEAGGTPKYGPEGSLNTCLAPSAIIQEPSSDGDF